MEHHIPAASNYEKACELLRSGHTKQVLLDWDVGNDEFFSIASDWFDMGGRIREDGNERLIISIRDLLVSTQSELV